MSNQSQPQLNEDAYWQIMAIVADSRRQTAGMVRSGRRDGLTDLSATERAHLETFDAAYASVADLEKFLLGGK